MTERIAHKGDRLIYLNTNMNYVVTDPVFHGRYAILKEVSDDYDILIAPRRLKFGSPSGLAAN